MGEAGDIDEGEVRSLIARGYRPRIKTVRGRPYIVMTSKREKTERSLGPYDKDRWDRVMALWMSETAGKDAEGAEAMEAGGEGITGGEKAGERIAEEGKIRGVEEEGVEEKIGEEQKEEHVPRGLKLLKDVCSELGLRELDVVRWIKKGYLRNVSAKMDESGRGYVYYVDPDEVRAMAEKMEMPSDISSAETGRLIDGLADAVLRKIEPGLRDLVSSIIREEISRREFVAAERRRIKPGFTANVSVPLDSELLCIYEVENDNWKRMFPGRGDLPMGLWIAATVKHHYKECRGYRVAVEIPVEGEG